MAYRVMAYILMACAVVPAPETCDTIAPLLGGDAERGAEVLAVLVGGYDARMGEAGPGRCDPGAQGDCNAVGVCLRFEASPAQVAGIAP